MVVMVKVVKDFVSVVLENLDMVVYYVGNI